jgi:hypothetical protein
VEEENRPLYAAHLLVALLRKLALHSNHRLEAGIKVGHAQLEQLGQLRDELFVQEVEDLFRVVELLLCL